MEVVVLSSELQPGRHSSHVYIDLNIIIRVVLVIIECVDICKSISVVCLTVIVQESSCSFALNQAKRVDVEVNWLLL